MFLGNVERISWEKGNRLNTGTAMCSGIRAAPSDFEDRFLPVREAIGSGVLVRGLLSSVRVEVSPMYNNK
jgi:hypothetical protein